MMRVELDQMLMLSRLYPAWQWSAVPARHVIVASDGVVLRLYWMPVLLRIDEFRAQLFVQELNRVARAQR